MHCADSPDPSIILVYQILALFPELVQGSGASFAPDRDHDCNFRTAASRCSHRHGSPAGARTLRFQIQGLLRVDPTPEQVIFDTLLELSSGEYEVR